jgi:hypothetical protein
MALHPRQDEEDQRMSLATPNSVEEQFVDRRSTNSAGSTSGQERRQFANSHKALSPAARELAEAIDGYKLRHRRRFITFEEMLHVIHELGYTKGVSR